MLKKIILAPYRGFCAGVDRAILVVEECLKKFGRVYVNHQIVHNTFVVSDLEKKGAVFIDDIESVPEHSILIYSAHGVSPQLKSKTKNLNLIPIDATCPLVTKVHIEAIDFYRRGYSIVFIGHRNHQEAIGTIGYSPMYLVEDKTDIENLKIDNDKIVYLTQTTLSIDDTKNVVASLKEKFPNIESPKKEDICYATQNRQDSVKELAKTCQLILVVGSKNSSNSKRLVETSKSYGVNSFLIDDKSQINFNWFQSVETIGITSGASVPEFLVQEVVNEICSHFGKIEIENVERANEGIEFILPKELIL